MTEVAIQEANNAFGRQVAVQVTRIAGELNRLERLLSAGMVDRRVVAELKDAVDKVRKTSEHVQYWMDGDLQSLSSTLIQERIQAASQLASLLAADLRGGIEEFSGITTLKDVLQKLGQVLCEEVSPR